MPWTMEELTEAELARLRALRQRHLNGSSGTMGMPKYECPECCDTGYREIRKGGYAIAHECECGRLRRERLARKLKFAAIPKEFEGLTVDNFRTDVYSAEHSKNLAKMAKKLAAEYIGQFQEIKESGKGFYFYSGTKGSGKTRLAVSIANDLIEKQKTMAKFATTLQILDQIKRAWGERAGIRGAAWQESEQKLMDDIISVPVLVVDDIGIEQPKDWVNERFYSIINGRMTKKQVTMFTSNCRMEELKLDERIVSRIEKMSMPIEFPAESIRRATARKENSALMERLLGI